MRTYLTMVMLALALGAGPSAAAVESMTVQVDGLVCPFCVYGLEKQLKKLPSVEGVRVDVDAGHAVLQLAETARLVDPEDPGSGLIAAVREAVESGGFTPRILRITASGRLETRGDITELVVSGTAERIAVDTENLDPPREVKLGVDGVLHDVDMGAVLEIRQLLDTT